MAKITRRVCFGMAGGLAIIAAQGRTANGPNEPPLYLAWRNGAPGRVYIFGSAITTNHSWLTPKIKAAMDQSTELWQEDSPTPCAFNAKLNIELGTRRSGRLFDDLTPAQQARVTHAARALRISLDLLQKMRPWGAGAVVASADYPRHMSTYKVDDSKAFIEKMFQDRGASVIPELPECDDWVRFYAGFPRRAAVQYLMYQIDLTELPPDDFMQWSVQWLHGDVSGWELFNRRLRTRYPDLYQVLEWQRNDAWARRIDTALARGGAHFLVVGIEHTVGPGSIQARVMAHGANVRLVSTDKAGF